VVHMPPVEVVAHRVIWSVPVAGMLLILLGRTRDLREALTTPRTLAMAALTAILISINWGIYVWAVASGNTLDAALGYYINPLFSVVLGALLLRERSNPTQMVAIALAALAVVIITVDAGRLPWISIGLTLSWGFYALCKKSLPIGPNQGFMLEVLILSAPAVIYVLYLAGTGDGHFGGATADTLLLLGFGIVTTAPLVLFGNGAKLLKLSTMGILQFIAPTLMFVVAVLIFGEDFSGARLVAFPMIWAALIIYSIPMVRQMRA